MCKNDTDVRKHDVTRLPREMEGRMKEAKKIEAELKNERKQQGGVNNQ